MRSSYREAGLIVLRRLNNCGQSAICCFAANGMARDAAKGKNCFRGEIIGIAEPDTVAPAASAGPRHIAEPDDDIPLFRPPRAEDGPGITALIAACPPLDTNSAYCNLLQCSHFAETCVVAERAGAIVGWISAYRPPSAPERIFVWQVAVAASARGTGLGGRMLDALIERPAARGAAALITTITKDNAASWGLFAGFARKRGMTLTKAPLFEREAHFAGAHDTEWQATIAPLPKDSRSSTKEDM